MEPYRVRRQRHGQSRFDWPVAPSPMKMQCSKGRGRRAKIRVCARIMRVRVRVHVSGRSPPSFDLDCVSLRSPVCESPVHPCRPALQIRPPCRAVLRSVGDHQVSFLDRSFAISAKNRLAFCSPLPSNTTPSFLDRRPLTYTVQRPPLHALPSSK